MSNGSSTGCHYCMFEADSVCGSHSIAIPLVLALPYLFRLFQCLRQYKDTREKTTLFNALKYSTAIHVIFLSALEYHVHSDRWTNFYQPLWLLSSVLNSLYSFYWDVTRDWDLRVRDQRGGNRFSTKLLHSDFLVQRATSMLIPLIWTQMGICLGDRKQFDLAMHLDLQAVCTSPA